MRGNFQPADPGDRSGLSLWSANLAVLVITLLFSYSVTLAISYWAEGCVLGLFHFLRLRAIARHRSGDEAEEARFYSRAFAVGFGLFHVAFWWPLPYSLVRIHPYYTVTVLAGVAVLGAHHAYSFRRNLAEDRRGRPGWRAGFVAPLARLVPLYFGLAGGAVLIGTVLETQSVPEKPLLVAVVLVKSVGDHFAHRLEHHLLRRNAGELHAATSTD